MKTLSLFFIVLISSSMALANCPAGMEFVNNRCVMGKKMMETAKESSRCMALTGTAKDACFFELSCIKQSGKAKSNCISMLNRCRGSEDFNECLSKKNADKNGSKKSLLGGSLDNWANPPMILAVATAAAGFMMINKSGGACKAPSALAIFSGGMAAAGAEVLSHISYQKEIDKIKDKYIKDDIQNGDQESGLAQTKAFDLMIEQENAYQKAIKAKNAGYVMARVAFGTAAILALIENYTEAGGISNNFLCTETASGKQELRGGNLFWGGLILAAMAPGLKSGIVQNDSKQDLDYVDELYKTKERVAQSRGETFEFDQKEYDYFKKAFDELGLSKEDKKAMAQSMAFSQLFLGSPLIDIMRHEVSSQKGQASII